MRYSIAVKFIAILLTAVALVAVFAGTLGITQVAQLGLYTDGFDGWVQNRLKWQAYDLAKDLTERYAVRELTNCPDDFLEQLGYWYVFQDSIHWTGFAQESYDFVITDANGESLADGKGLAEGEEGKNYQTVCSVQFPVLVTDEAAINEEYGTEYVRRETVYAEMYNNKPVIVRYYESPEYMVDISLDADAAMDRSGTSLELVKLVYEQRYNLMIILAVALIIGSAGFVYLCCAAGKKTPKDVPMPAGLNRLPLDVYVAAAGVGGYLLAMLAVSMINYWIFSMDNLNPGTLVLVGLVLLGVALLCVGVYFAVCAQIKTKELFWWRNSLLCRLWGKIWIGLQFIGKSIVALVELLPVIWRYILIGAAMAGTIVAAAVLAYQVSIVPLLVVICLNLAVLLYGAYAYGTILRGAERMAKGNLDSKIETRFLLGYYKKCARHLNALADVAIVAAQKQMRSDRMKTELITNISHDIKTPLTSIINYVDILQSTSDAEAAKQYLEVLGRQSQRLKKLIDDLMEMSKATTGNIHVNITALDPVETINQALGEFSDKLEAKGLTVVFQQPEVPALMKADGRLTWRVLSNLLSNIVKYAMPGTRVYIDAMQVESKVLISLKNISAEALNVSADELTERFVRGDTSRNTEGSGLGLNIAKSLMDLQRGQLRLLVDGDLFKATLVFPRN